MTQNERVLDYLEQHKGIEPMTALSELGVFRLAARIADLKKDGHNIKSEMIDVWNRWGEKATVAYYQLEPNADCTSESFYSAINGGDK